MIIAGVVHALTNGGLLHRTPPPTIITIETLTLFLLLTAFASGRAGITDVDAISNGVCQHSNHQNHVMLRVHSSGWSLLGERFWRALPNWSGALASRLTRRGTLRWTHKSPVWLSIQWVTRREGWMSGLPGTEVISSDLDHLCYKMREAAGDCATGTPPLLAAPTSAPLFATGGAPLLAYLPGN